MASISSSFLHALVDRLVVGQHAAEPALGHIGHARLLGVLADGDLGLLLGSDEQDGAALGADRLEELGGLVQVLEGPLQIDDVDAAPGDEDVGFHLGVPLAGLMPEVDACFEQVLQSNVSHDCLH